MRTSMLSEFRDASGGLGAFELSGLYTTVGATCAALARLPGIQFDAASSSVWSTRSGRFTFKERAFEVSLSFADIRIAPVEVEAVYRETEELLRIVAENLLPKWQTRARSRLFRG